MSLSTPDRSRLAKLLGMLGSDHDGEVQAAARKVRAFAMQHKLDWATLLGDGSQAGPRSARSTYEPPGPADGGDLSVCLRHLHALTDWEFGFVQSLSGKFRRSPKQLATLRGIAAELRRKGFA